MRRNVKHARPIDATRYFLARAQNCRIGHPPQPCNIVWLGTGPSAESLALTKRSLALYEQMAARDVIDLNARRDLAQSYRNMAKVLFANKDVVGAIEFNSKALAIFQELVPKDQSNTFSGASSR